MLWAVKVVAEHEDVEQDYASDMSHWLLVGVSGHTDHQKTQHGGDILFGLRPLPWSKGIVIIIIDLCRGD